jgi:hypothetical protein
MLLILLGEVVPGGVGSGLYTILAFAIIAVFIAGLMIGRTPEYLGKKIEVFEMWMSVLIVLTSGILVLIFVSVALVAYAGISSILNPGPHGLSEVLYAFASASNNNGSAFAGLNASTLFYNLLTAIACHGRVTFEEKIYPAKHRYTSNPSDYIRLMACRCYSDRGSPDVLSRPVVGTDCGAYDYECRSIIWAILKQKKRRSLNLNSYARLYWTR